MSLFNTEAAGDVKLFRENNDKYAKRAADIIRAGGASMDLQLIKDFIAIQGLDLVADKDKIIHICKEIGVEPKALGIEIIGLTGKTGGKLKEIADICICAPETETFKIQELHLPIYHYICAKIESYFFND